MRLGFIGLGNIGGPMAASLARNGHPLIVHDIQREAAELHCSTERWAGTAAELAAEADVVLLSLPGPREVEAVIFDPGGLAANLRAGAVIVDLSTNSPAVVGAISARLAGEGIAFADAPVSGGAARAAQGKLAIWVGATTVVFSSIRPILAALGDRVTHIGDVGAGSIAKLMHNQLLRITYGALAEVFAVAIKAGIKADTLRLAFSEGMYGDGPLNFVPDVIISGEFDWSQFPYHLDILQKDVALALALGREMGVAMPISTVLAQEMAHDCGTSQ